MIPQLEYPSILQQLGGETKDAIHEVLAWLDLLTDDPLSPAQFEHIDQCRKSLQRIIRINEDAWILGSGTPSEGEQESFSPAERTLSILKVLEPLAAQRNLKVDVDVPSSMAAVEADRAGFEQVVSRTVGFAIRSLENSAFSVSLRSSAPNSTGMVTIHAALRFQEHPAEPDDISLHVAVQIANRMGGVLRYVVDELEQGLDFSFEAKLAGAGSSSPDSESRLRILVAEDSDESFYLFSAMLLDQPYRVTRAHDGEEAVALAISGQYDIAFMDITMPRLNGYSATLRIREWETKHCRRRMPIIVLSADPLESQIREGATVGCSGYLEKPVPGPVLLETLRRYGADLQRDQTQRGAHKYDTSSSPDYGVLAFSRPRAEVASVLRPVVPQFLATQQKYLAAIEDALTHSDFERIRIIGHNMKGTGTGYGFPPISEIGRALESAGEAENVGVIRSQLSSLSKYLSEVDVVYTK